MNGQGRATDIPQHLWLGTTIDRWLLIGALLSIGALWWQLAHHFRQGPPMVWIYHDTTLLARYPLRAEQAIDFAAQGDIGATWVHIEHGQVSILRSPCRLQRCVHSGQRHENGDFLLCVPNRIAVFIRGKQEEGALDAIAE